MRNKQGRRASGFPALTFVLVVLALIAAACSSSEVSDTTAAPDAEEPTTTASSGEPPASSTPTTEAPEPEGEAGGGTLRYWLSLSPNLDPREAPNRSETNTLTSALFDRLVVPDENGEPAPALAESWEVSEDGTEYTFTLRSDAQFSDGSEITAEDVVYSLRRAYSILPEDRIEAFGLPSGTGYAYQVLPYVLGATATLEGEATELPDEAIEAVDDHTVSIRLEEAKGDFLARFAHFAFAIVQEENVEASTADNLWWHNPVTSGAFTIASFADERIVLEPNENWRGDGPALDSVEFVVVEDRQTALSMFESGQLDIIQPNLGDVPNLMGAGFEDQLVGVVEPITAVFLVNAQVEPMNDPAVARALWLSIDRTALAESLLEGVVEPATTLTPPIVPGYDLDEMESFDFDPEAAAQEFAATGIEPSSFTIRIWASPSQDPRLAQAIAGMWQQHLGINTQIMEEQPPADASPDEAPHVLLAGQGATHMAPSALVDRIDNYRLFVETANNVNFGYLEVPGLADLLEEIHATSGEEAWALVAEAEQLLRENPAFIPVLWQTTYWLVNPAVQNVDLRAPMWLADLHEVSIGG